MKAVELVAGAVRGLSGGTNNRVVVVALDGRSGAGKSTLAAALADMASAAVVHGDDFYADMPEADRLGLSPAQGVDRYFDWERLRAEALMPLLRHEPARVRRFDWMSGHGLTTATTVEPHDIVIVEGVYAARPQFDDLVDLKVLVEVADDERDRRRDGRRRTVSRDDADGWDARWDAAERIYFDTIRTRESFDLVVSGDA